MNSLAQLKTAISKILFGLLICGFINISAQNEPDTVLSVQSNDSVFVMHKSPWGAVARSAILPGLGQFYNESYWKIPVVWGFIGYYIYGWTVNNNNYKLYRNAYRDSDYSVSGYKTKREFYRDQRDLFAIYLGITYFLNLVDAYVDAHLFDFTVSENLNTNSSMLNFRINLR